MMNRILTILLLSLLVAGAAGRHKERKHKRHGSWSEWGSKQLARVWPLQALSRTHSAPQTGIAMTASLDGLRYVSHALLPVIEGAIGAMDIPEQTFDRNSFVGGLRGLRCGGPGQHPPSVGDLSLHTAAAGHAGAPVRIAVKAFNVSVVCTGEWWYKQKWIGWPAGQGTVTATVTGADAGLLVGVGSLHTTSAAVAESSKSTPPPPAAVCTERHLRPIPHAGLSLCLNAHDPTASIGDLSVAFQGGGLAGWLLQTLTDMSQDTVKAQVTGALRGALVSAVVDTASPALSALTRPIPLNHTATATPLPATADTATAAFSLTAAELDQMRGAPDAESWLAALADATTRAAATAATAAATTTLAAATATIATAAQQWGTQPAVDATVGGGGAPAPLNYTVLDTSLARQPTVHGNSSKAPGQGYLFAQLVGRLVPLELNPEPARRAPFAPAPLPDLQHTAVEHHVQVVVANDSAASPLTALWEAGLLRVELGGPTPGSPPLPFGFNSSRAWGGIVPGLPEAFPDSPMAVNIAVDTLQPPQLLAHATSPQSGDAEENKHGSFSLLLPLQAQLVVLPNASQWPPGPIAVVGFQSDVCLNFTVWMDNRAPVVATHTLMKRFKARLGRVHAWAREATGLGSGAASSAGGGGGGGGGGSRGHYPYALLWPSLRQAPDDRPWLHAHVYNLSAPLSLSYSLVGPVDVAYIDRLLREALDEIAVPLVNKVLARGLPIPPIRIPIPAHAPQPTPSPTPTPEPTPTLMPVVVEEAAAGGQALRGEPGAVTDSTSSDNSGDSNGSSEGDSPTPAPAPIPQDHLLLYLHNTDLHAEDGVVRFATDVRIRR